MSRGLVIVDHGSRKPEAHEHLERVAEAVRARAPELVVRVAHMELAEPDLAAALEACVEAGVDEIAVHPLFLVPGRHLSEDIPRLLAEAAERHPGVRVRLLEPVGSRPELAELILATLD